MLFEDQFEQLKEYYQSVESRALENSTVNSLRDKYSNLSPLLQKILLGAFCFLAVFLVLAGPIANYRSSVENMTAFETRNALTEKMISYQKKSKSAAPKPKEYNLTTFKQATSDLAKSYSINFLPDQVSVATARPGKKMIPAAEQNNFDVKTTKSNIDQVTALTYSLQKLNTSLSVESLELNANREDSAYFDSSIIVANLFVRSVTDILPKPEASKKKKSRKRRGRR